MSGKLICPKVQHGRDVPSGIFTPNVYVSDLRRRRSTMRTDDWLVLFRIAWTTTRESITRLAVCPLAKSGKLCSDSMAAKILSYWCAPRPRRLRTHRALRVFRDPAPPAVVGIGEQRGSWGRRPDMSKGLYCSDWEWRGPFAT